jgi:hypothetical protein
MIEANPDISAVVLKPLALPKLKQEEVKKSFVKPSPSQNSKN